MFQEILTELKTTNTQLVAISKTKSPEQVLKIYAQGQRIFGENKVQELVDKQEALPKDIEWHFIGHLQTNKVKYIASFINLLHAIDSLKLLKEINKQAKKHNRIIDGLLQFHIAEEENKFGLSLEEAKSLLSSDAFKELQNVRIVGVMGMATNTKNKEQVQSEFKELVGIFHHLKNTFFENDTAFKEISMGMSGDYKIAMTEGSTMVRIGSLIFKTI